MTNDEKAELANKITDSIESWLKDYLRNMMPSRDDIFDQVMVEMPEDQDEDL
jgi:hypothetical protein